MSIMANNEGGTDFKKVPEGTHLAVCNMIVDLGMQRGEYMGEPKLTHQVYVRWELPHERNEWEKDGQKFEGPMQIGKTYTLSLGEKANLFKDLTSWRGKAFTGDELRNFDVTTVAGACCQINVVHKVSGNGKTYTNVSSVAGWPKGMDRVAADEVIVFEDGSDPSTLPEWLRSKVLAQVINESTDQVYEGPEDDSRSYTTEDEIPF